MQKISIDAGFLEKLKYNNDLVSVISSYIPLKVLPDSFNGI